MTEQWKKAKDHSLREPRAGRYENDYFAEMTVLPGVKKPYRVLVWIWRTPTWKSDGTDPSWYAAKKISMVGGDYEHEYHFKYAWKAAEFLGEVRGKADAHLIVQRATAAHEAGRTLLA